MKLNDILAAREPLKRLSEKRFASYKKMRELVKLRKAVEQEFDFYYAEEKKAVSNYAEHDENGAPIFLDDGRLRLKDYASKQAFEKEIATLRDTEVDGIERITLSEADFRTSADLPTPDEMIALEAFIDFED